MSRSKNGRWQPKKILDLFCGAGGAAAGLHTAFPDAKILGIDINRQPHYPFEFRQEDAMEWLDDRERFRYAELVWASPPCQLFTRASHLRTAQGNQSREKVDLLTPTLERLRKWDGVYVVENVVGAPLDGFVLCGSMFGLKVRRHRIFETNPKIGPSLECDHKSQGRPVGVYHCMNDSIPCGGQTARTLEEGQQAMGIDWMNWKELTQAIPPAYSRWIGSVLTWRV